MQETDTMSEKKKALLEYKQSLLNRIRNYERSIEETRSKHRSANVAICDDSSDSESEQPQPSTGPTLGELQHDCSQLSVCLQATQELTSLQVLESEVNVLVEPPPLEAQELRDIPEGGTWREVTAECRLDLVPFSITFYVHEAPGPFPSRRYRRVSVTCVRAAHAAELAPPLRPCTTPSEAVQVVSDYSKAARSRRSSLAALSRAFGAAVRMEALDGGGYGVRCAGVLHVEWGLLNKGSRLAPFRHRLKFNLDPIDEVYVKQIRQLHRRLSEPTLETDERTLVLSKIIEICIEVGQSNAESSDTETLNRSRNTVDQLPDVDTEHSRAERSLVENQGKGRKGPKEAALMAPPSQPPRKAKRPAQDPEDGVAKKAKSMDGDKGNGQKSSKAGDDVAKKAKPMDSDKESNGARSKESGKVKQVQSKDAKKTKDGNKDSKGKVADGAKSASDVKDTVAPATVAKSVEKKVANVERPAKDVVSNDANKENGKNTIKPAKSTDKTKQPTENPKEAKIDKTKKVTDIKKLKDNIKPTKALNKHIHKDIPKPTKQIAKTDSTAVEKILSGNRAPETSIKNNPKTKEVKKSISSTTTNTFMSKIPRSKLPLKALNRGGAVFKRPEAKDPRIPLKSDRVGDSRHSGVRSSPRSLKPPFKPRSMFKF